MYGLYLFCDFTSAPNLRSLLHFHRSNSDIYRIPQFVTQPKGGASLSSSERTFYNYQLLKRIRFHRVFMYMYLLFGAAALAASIGMSGLWGVAYIGASWVVIVWIHYVIARSIFVMDRYTFKKRWIWRFNLPWIGFLPQEQQFISLRYWRKILWHTTLISLLVLVMIMPWLPLGLTLQLFFWHLWMMAPRLYATFVAQSASKDGLIKLPAGEMSVYKA